MTITRLTTALLLASSMFAAAAQEIGKASAIRNEVSVQSEDEDTSRAAAVGTGIKMRDLITSGDNSAMQMLLVDQTVFTVGPRAELVVDEFVYDPESDAGEMTARVTKGAFRFMSGRTAKNPENVRIETPVASMGIRGTIVEGAVGEDAVRQLSGLEGQFEGVPTGPEATILVLRGPSTTTGDNLTREGEVTITTPNGTVTLTRTNSAVFIPGPGAAPIGPFPLPQQAVQSFGQQVVSVPTGEPVSPVPDIQIPQSNVVVEEEPVEPEPQEPEEENVVERPTMACPVLDGIPVTDGGLILDGGQGGVIDDFGSLECMGDQ